MDPLPETVAEEAPVDLSRRVRALVRLAVQRLRRLAFMHLPPEEAQKVREHVEEEGALTERYMLMCALSAGIATLGLLQSSAAVVIGAMLVSPLMGPIAALGFGVASLDGPRMLRAGRALGAGALVGVSVGIAITWLTPIRNATPELIARTAPTLLDLGVALLSGLAGGYATVHRRGEPAIGVAIATALMPPLATIGYSIAVLRLDFLLGAGLLFLTNLAAIAMCFALVSRLRGISRPLHQVKITRGLVLAVVVGVIILIAPLGMTLRRLTQEAIATQAARQEIVRLLDTDTSHIAQLSVSWPNMEPPRVTAIAIIDQYVDGAEDILRERLTGRLGVAPTLTLEQLVATDSRAETQAMISAALTAQTQAQRAQAPPIEAVRAALRMPTLAIFADTSSRVITVLPAPAGLTLAQMHAEEVRLDAVAQSWSVRLTPPFEQRLHVPLASEASEVVATDAQMRAVLWALERWNVSHVRVEGFAGRDAAQTEATRALATSRMESAAALLRAQEVTVVMELADGALSRALLSGEGEARVQGLDVLPLPAAATPTPPQPPAP